MSDPKKYGMDKTPEKSKGAETVPDDYTAKMDRLVSNLKKQSMLDRQQRLKLTVIWFGIACVITILMIYLMMTLTSTSFENAFPFLR